LVRSKAEELEVSIFPGFAASEVLYHEDGTVKGFKQVIWELAKMVSQHITSRLVMNSMQNIRYLLKVAVVILVSA
jgi:electron-transferring-flavoprotein dehydrogenase